MIIRSDFLSTSITFDNGTHSPLAGNSLRGIISWKNTLDVPVNDTEFSLKINGDLIDQKAISVDRGYYNSSQSRIIWDKQSYPDLGDISPGTSGQLTFTLPLLDYDYAVSHSIKNPKISLVLDVSARRLSDRNATEDISSSFSKEVPIRNFA